MTRSLSKKIRFDVFKRDGFVCQYCGNSPPKVVLEVDHIIAVCASGSNHIDNLTTACFDCNRGKAGSPLSSIPASIETRVSLAKERELQLKALKQLHSKVQKRIASETLEIYRMYQESFPLQILTPQFRSSSIGKFLTLLPFSEVEEAMSIACNRITGDTAAFKYFCGICWKKIRGGRT